MLPGGAHYLSGCYPQLGDPVFERAASDGGAAMAETRGLVLPEGEPADSARGSIFFVGTATVILRWAGLTILTDPNFLHQGDHVHLGYGLRSRRRTQPAIMFHQLPPLDLVLLSHLHEDHWDRVAERRLDHGLPIVTTPQAAKALATKGFRAAQGLDRWESLTVRKGSVGVRITAMPGIHGPRAVSKLLPAVMGSMLELLDGEATRARLYISGDTLVHDDLREIPRRFPEIDLALLHLGGTRIARVLLTMDATQGVQALTIIGARLHIPIHYDDYEVFKSPLADFMRAVHDAGLQDRVRYLDRGDTYTFEVPAVAR